MLPVKQGGGGVRGARGSGGGQGSAHILPRDAFRQGKSLQLTHFCEPANIRLQLRNTAWIRAYEHRNTGTQEHCALLSGVQGKIQGITHAFPSQRIPCHACGNRRELRWSASIRRPPRVLLSARPTSPGLGRALGADIGCCFRGPQRARLPEPNGPVLRNGVNYPPDSSPVNLLKLLVNHWIHLLASIWKGRGD